MAKKNLLLVDADSKSLRMLEVSLRKSGFSVTTAITAADAREKVKLAAPDLIITDTKLPGDENGFELVANLKANPDTQGVPVIFLSSENKLELKVTGLELGVEDYLTKPIYIKEVLTRVRVLLEKRERERLERRERSSTFSGSLGEMGLVDLMQTVEMGRKTGRLHIETRFENGAISFREGKVCDARCGRLSGERAFYRMLVWAEGVFNMEFGAHDDKDVIELSTQGLLMEGMRRVDEWGRLLEQLPPLDHRFEIDYGELVDRLAEIPDEINGILRLFDGRRKLLEVVDESDFGDLEALEICSKLFFEGLIYDVSSREPDAIEPQSVARIEAWLDDDTAGARGDVDADSALKDVPDVADDVVIGAPDADVALPGAGSVVPVSVVPQAATESDDDGLDSAPLETTPVDRPPRTLTPTPRPASPAFSLSPPEPQRADEPAPPATSTAPLLPTRVPGFLASERPGDPPPRPLPENIKEEPEPRAVTKRQAANVTAWSTAPQKVAGGSGLHDDGWEDIVAPSDIAGADGEIDDIASALDESAARARADSLPTPPPSPLPAASPGSLSSSPSGASEPLDHPTDISPAPPVAREGISLGRSGLAEIDDNLTLSPLDQTPVQRRRDLAVVLPRPKNEDELAARVAKSMADSLAPSDADTRMSDAAPTLVDRVASVVDDDSSALAASLAASLAADAQGGPAPSSTSVSPASVTPAAITAALPETTPSRPLPPPAPATEASRAASALSALPEPDDRIHRQPTALDIEPLDDDAVDTRVFGLRLPVAAGVFLGGFVVVLLAFTVFRGREGVGAADAGIAPVIAVDAVVDAGPGPGPSADAGSTVAAATVVDAGPAAAVDAGTVALVAPPAVRDAGPAAAVDAGPAADVESADPEVVYVRQMQLAEAFSRKGEFGKSVRAYKAALAQKPNATAAHVGLGNAYYELDSIQPAIFHLEKARRLAPDDPQVFVLLGAVYQSAGRKDDAVATYRRYLVLAPQGKFAKDVRGILRGMGVGE